MVRRKGEVQLKEKLILPSGRTLSDVVTGVTVQDRTTERSDAVFMAARLREMYEQLEAAQAKLSRQILEDYLELTAMQSQRDHQQDLAVSCADELIKAGRELALLKEIEPVGKILKWINSTTALVAGQGLERLAEGDKLYAHHPISADHSEDALHMVELTQAQIDVMGRPSFACSNIARYLIKKGIYKAPEKIRAESEQAIAIHFLLPFLEKYGEDWSKEADKFLEYLAAPQSEVKPS